MLVVGNFHEPFYAIALRTNDLTPSPMGQPSSQHPLLWCGVNSTLFGKQQLDQPPVSALVYNMPAQWHRVFQVVQGG